mgnify:CR=1 FL=1
MKASTDGFLGNLVKFDYEYEILVESPNQAIIKCVDFVESKDGCFSVFTAHNVLSFNEEGKISKSELIAGDRDMANLFKCLAPPPEL